MHFPKRASPPPEAEPGFAIPSFGLVRGWRCIRDEGCGALESDVGIARGNFDFHEPEKIAIALLTVAG